MDVKAYISSGTLEAYMLGSLPEHEAAGVACLAASHAEIAQEIVILQEALAGLADQVAVQPPAGLQDKIWASLSAQQGFANDAPNANGTVDPATSINDGEAPRGKVIPMNAAARRPAFAWAQAAMLVGLLALGALALYQRNESQELMRAKDSAVAQLAQSQAALNEQNQLLASFQKEHDMMLTPGMNMVMMRGSRDGHDMGGMVFWDKKKSEAYVSLAGMPAPPAGKQYQLWAIADGKPVSLGVMPVAMAGKPGADRVPMAVPAGQAFAISLEPMGGVASPTADMVLVVGAVQG